MPLMKTKDVVLSLFVRTALDTERVDYFRSCLQNKVQFDNIEVDEKSNILLDGRHRFEAFKLEGYTEVPFKAVVAKNRATAIYYATSANLGGALPPKRADIAHAVNQLCKEGQTDAQILANIKFPGLKNIIHNVRRGIENRKAEEALKFRNDKDVSYRTAAEKFEVDESILRALATKERPKNINAALSRQLGALNKSHGLKLASLLKQAREAVSAETLTEAEMFDLFTRVEQGARFIRAQAENNRTRFEADRRLAS